MKARKPLTENQKLFALLLQDQVHFNLYFGKNELTLPPSTRQKLMWNDVSKRTILATGRKSYKTGNLELRIIRKSLAYRQHERLSERAFGTPGENQLVPVRSRILTRINSNPLFKLMLEGFNKNEGMLRWRTNVVWHFRLDGTSGDDRNWVGLRLDEIIFDEAAFTIRQCHSSRKQSALPQCQWLYTGVPNSVRHTPFHELDQLPAKGRGWSHHKTSTYANPLYWSEQAREALIEDYGKDSPDYTAQVMGCWGVELYSSFPPDAIAVNDALPYRIAVLTPNELPRTLAIDPLARTRLAAKIQMPRVKAAQYVLGMDYGFLQDPTEIGVAYRDDLDTNEWRMLARLEVLGVDALTQAYLLSMLVEMLGRERVGAVCVDLQHAGLEIAHELTRPGSEYPVEWWQAAIVDLNSNGIVEVVDPRDESRHLKVRRKQYITQQLQSALLAAKANLGGVFRLWLGKDEQMFQELVDTREQKMASGYVVYIPRNMGKNKPVDHITDLLRGIIAAAAWAQDNAIGAGGLGDMAAAQGWGGNPFRKEWSSTWDRTQVTSAKVERY